MEKININIDKDDYLVNDYLFCLSEFSEIPNKISIFNNYDIDKFIQFIDQKATTKNISKEIIPSGSEYIINERHFIKLDDIYISFTEYDNVSDLGYITDIIIYYKNGFDSIVNSFLESINEFTIGIENIGSDHKFNIVTLTSDGLQLEPIDLIDADYENIELYFNKRIIQQSNNLIKSIQKNKKGLTIIYGERGLGKTTLSNWISSKLDKITIFISSDMIDIINTSDFKNLIKKNKNSMIIIDDSEIYFSSNYTKSNILTNSILQMVDGVASDMNNIHIIVILNKKNIGDIDPVLLDCNNIIDTILVNRLDDSKVDKLCSHLKLKNKLKNPRLVDVIKNKKNISNSTQIGFN